MSLPAEIRLTRLARGGGCGCKIAPGILEKILAQNASGLISPSLLVGLETADDAAVYQINEHQAVVATTDFFTPIVDDPGDFGRIAATNAISDIYAMGATPLFALALVGMPLDTLPLEFIGRILAGGEAACRAANIPVAGGHSIDSAEPIYGLAVIGLVDPAQLKRNAKAMPGDRLILGKPLGIGIYSAALKKGKLSPTDYEALIAATTQLNTPGPLLGCLDGVHALTDVTGFGLLGHLLEICRASGVAANLDFASLPLLPHALELAAEGYVTGASGRNWESYGTLVHCKKDPGAAGRALLTDPQTSGGLLVSCAPDTVTEVLSLFLQQGFAQVSVIGEVLADEPHIRVHVKESAV